MKPEYIKVMQRKIHTANQKMQRHKHGNQNTLFARYVTYMCPAWHISEKTGSEQSLYVRYLLALKINSISISDCKPGKYDDEYKKYLDNNEYASLSPDDWKIKWKVQ